MRGLLLLVLCLCALSAAAQAVIPFAKGEAGITPLPGYTHRLEESGETIVLLPESGLFEMRFTYHAVPVRKDHPQLAREFVLDLGRQKQKQVTRFRGTQSIGFIERGPPSMMNGEEQRNLQGILTLGQGYVTLLLSVPERNVNLPEMREFMKSGIDPLIAALRAKGSQ
jgi:hypothetical protein